MSLAPYLAEIIRPPPKPKAIDLDTEDTDKLVPHVDDPNGQ